MSEFHERLKLAREQAGFETATDAAKSMGVVVPTYLAHENGSRGSVRPSQAAIDKYARKFRVNYAWLARGEGLMRGDVEANFLGGLTDEEAKILTDLRNRFLSSK